MEAGCPASVGFSSVMNPHNAVWAAVMGAHQCANRKFISMLQLVYKSACWWFVLPLQRLIVCLEESLYIHNIRDMKVLHTIRETPPNPSGESDSQQWNASWVERSILGQKMSESLLFYHQTSKQFKEQFVKYESWLPSSGRLQNASLSSFLRGTYPYHIIYSVSAVRPLCLLHIIATSSSMPPFLPVSSDTASPAMQNMVSVLSLLAASANVAKYLQAAPSCFSRRWSLL